MNADGTYYYADVPLSIELPAAFTAGPDPAFGSVTGDATLRVDDAGVHYDGLKLQAKDVWLGKLKVHSVCFSYIPSGGTTTTPVRQAVVRRQLPVRSRSPAATQPFIQCATDPNTNRWDASAEIEVPSGLQIGAFGGLANGKISSLGASVNNLGKRVPLADGLYLDHVAFGLCLSPPPFKIRANVGANFLGASNFVNLDGGFTYTDAVGYNPWSLELDASVSIGEEPDALPIGSGTLGINGNGVIDFGLKAGVDVLGGFASLHAEVSGWIDAPHRQFVVGGEGQGCVDGQCATAEGELSSTGIAGCVTIGSSIPTYDLVIPLDGSAVHLDTTTYPLTAGFGYDWGASSAQLLGGSCDFSSYEPTHPAADRAAAAAAGMRVPIARGTERRRAPDPRDPWTAEGRPPRTARRHDHLAVERPREAQQGPLLPRGEQDGRNDQCDAGPSGRGNLDREPAPGSASSPTKIDRANLEAPPTFGARVLGKGGCARCRWPTRCRREHRCGSSSARRASTRRSPLPSRPSVPGSLRQAHAEAMRTGTRETGLPKTRPGTNEKILCATIRFRPRSDRAVRARAGGRDAARHPAAAEEHRVLPRAAPDAALPCRGAPRAARQGIPRDRVLAVAGARHATRCPPSSPMGASSRSTSEAAAARCESRMSRPASLQRSRSRGCASTWRWAARARSRSRPMRGRPAPAARSCGWARSAPDVIHGRG